MHEKNPASSAQLLPSTAISLPLDPLAVSDYSLWRSSDDGGEAQSTVLDLGLLLRAWGILYQDRRQEFSFWCAAGKYQAEGRGLLEELVQLHLQNSDQ